MATQIGVSDLHYALLLTDPVSGSPTYETPVRIPGLISININPNSSTETLFADDGPLETATTMGEIEVELSASDLPLELQAELLGHEVSANGIMTRKGSDTPPWVAIGFKSLKSNGKYRFVWLTKGRFSLPALEHTTRGDSVEFQTPSITGSFVKRENDGVWIKQTDEDLTGYVADLGTNWFSSVDYVPVP